MSEKAVPPDDQAKALREFQISESPRLKQLMRLLDREFERVDEIVRKTVRSSWKEFFRRHHLPENEGEIDFEGMALMLSNSLLIKGDEVTLPREAVELMRGLLSGEIARPAKRPKKSFLETSKKLLAIQEFERKFSELKNEGVKGAQTKALVHVAEEAHVTVGTVRSWIPEEVLSDKSALK